MFNQIGVVNPANLSPEGLTHIHLHSLAYLQTLVTERASGPGINPIPVEQKSAELSMADEPMYVR